VFITLEVYLKSLNVRYAQLFERLVVHSVGKFSSLEVGAEIILAPDGCLHFKQKRHVVAFIFLQLSAGVCNNAMYVGHPG